MKFKIITIVIFIVLGMGIYKLTKAYIQSRKDNQRLVENISHITKQLSYYKTKNGDLVAKNTVLIFRNSEFEKTFPELIKEIKNLRLKPKRVLSVTSTVLGNEKHIVTVLKDSIVQDTIIAKIFNYQDEFYKVKGIAINDTQRVEIQSIDSIFQVVYRGKRKKPYLWIFSKRQLEQVITNKNPNSKITYSKHIEIIKRK